MAQSTAPGREGLAEEHPGGAHFAPAPRSGLALAARYALGAFGGPDEASGWPAVALISLLAVVLTWRWLAWDPVQAGLSSWQAGLAIAFLHHLQWGPQVMFTFGPYGFLEDALAYSRLTGALGLAYALVLRWGLAALVVTALKKSWGLLGAGVAAWASVGLGAGLAEASDLATVVALGLALAALGQRGRARLVLLGLLGALAGLELLVEVTAGAVCTGLAVLAVAGARAGQEGGGKGGGQARVWWRDLLAAAIPWAGVALGALVVAGQDLSNLASYLRGSFSVVKGYTAAMSLSSGRVAEDWLGACVLALLGTVFALSLRHRAFWEKVVISLALVGWAWELAKEGFVRHDLHDLTFFGLMVPALCLARLARRLVPLQAGAVAAAAVFACVANASVPLSLRSPLESPRALAAGVADIASGARWAKVQQAVQRQSRRSGDALTGRLYRALLGHSFAALPVEDSLSVAYPALRLWDPEPVLQAYSAYTPYLDHLDSRFLASARAPAVILYRPVSIGHLNPAWEPPSATEAMYCHYAEAQSYGYWALLRRVPERCGRPELVGGATAHFGEAVRVPVEPHGAKKMVVATLSVSLPASTEVQDVAFKGPALYLSAWDTSGARSTYRFVAATAGDYHVMSAPASLGYTAGYGPATLKRFELSGGGWAAGQGSVRVRFYTVSLRPALARR